MRLCPKCGKKSEEARCPEDGTATLVFAANPDSRLTEGTEVNGRYRIREMIGQGGFGAVYKATNIATDQDMAIKLLAVSLDSDDSDVIQRFFAEAQVTASLKHPNTIRVFDFGQTEGGALYIAMELLSGTPLNDLLKKRGQVGEVLTEEEAINIGVQSLRSLAEAHLAKLVHRDLKPHNIFLHDVEGDDPVVKVLDFGIAKRLGTNLTGTGKAFGTPSYMSPEQAQNKPLDHRSDLYSLGCVLFQCVTGMPPFDGDNPLAVLLSHVTDRPPDLRNVARTPLSEMFIKVLDKALAKDPNDRYGSAIEMRQALEACRGLPKTETLRSPGIRESPTLSVSSGEMPAVGDDRTAAYVTPKRDVPAPELRTAAYSPPTPGALPTPAKPPTGPLQVNADNPTMGFFSHVPAEEPDAEAEAAPPPAAKSRAGLWIAAGVVVAIGAGVAVYLSGKSAGGAEEKADAKAAAAAPVEVKPPVVEKPAELAQSDVEVVSEPAGAMVQVGGKLLGKAPTTLHLGPGAKISAVLNLEGYVEREVVVSAEDGKQKVVHLTALPVTAQVPGKDVAPVVEPVKKGEPAKEAPGKEKAGKPHVTTHEKPKDKPQGGGSLEERL